MQVISGNVVDEWWKTISSPVKYKGTRLQTQYDQYSRRSGNNSHERAHSRKTEMEKVCQSREDEPDTQQQQPDASFHD
jgi:hypothetical protein